MKSPIEIWKQNKSNLSLRKYTRDFCKKFNNKAKLIIEPGSVYAVKYLTDNSIPTDKHHVTPLIASFGRFSDDNGKHYIRSLNLFYLKNEQKLEFLEDFYKYENSKLKHKFIQDVHEKWIKIVPYTFKNLEERRIIGIDKISNYEYGIIPLLKFHLIGNFNAVALNEDFQEENKSFKKPNKKIKSKKEVINEDEDDEEFEEVELDLSDDSYLDI